MKTESAVEDEIRLLAPKLGGILWRNNNGAFQDATGRWIRYGLANESQKVNRKVKSSDLIGLMPVTIRPEHVGRTFGVFVACEVKREGWHLQPSNTHEAAQLRYLEIVHANGGLAFFAQSVDDFVARCSML